MHARVEGLAARARSIATQLVSLYQSSSPAPDREFILETATEVRILLMQIDIQ